MKKLYQQLKEYKPYNRQEDADKALMLEFMERNPDALLRSNKAAHFAATAWVVNKDRTKVLMVYHNIYKSWAWSGGHADGESDLEAVARREIAEETGLTGLKPLCDGIFAINVLTVERHIKKGRPVASHLHLDVEYLFEADDSLPLRVKEDENSAVSWVNIADINSAVTEEKMKPVYALLVEKAKKY
ncbi:MAG: NUDIX hydrolase [Oscillospiraceae bacterium]|nr:NUDIX hydrolase [Oscillospiraceae bacterium]